MRAFSHPQFTKQDYIADLSAREAAGLLQPGCYYNPATRCACYAGASIVSINRRLGTRFDTASHFDLARVLDVPQLVTYLGEFLFERLPAAEAPAFALRFARAIPQGADLCGVADAVRAWVRALPHLSAPEIAGIERDNFAVERVALIATYASVLRGVGVDVEPRMAFTGTVFLNRQESEAFVPAMHAVMRDLADAVVDAIAAAPCPGVEAAVRCIVDGVEMAVQDLRIERNFAGAHDIEVNVRSWDFATSYASGPDGMVEVLDRAEIPARPLDPAFRVPLAAEPARTGEARPAPLARPGGVGAAFGRLLRRLRAG